ncbi:hypothetical protein [Dactylosporangium sp. NPDC051541]|uniref:hypothetical protein n=1 Tax=Dactylosporangium sp. NPDC051541 TaxID=3363977 RepID=UPI00378ED0C5
MRHVGSLIAGMLIAPIAWLLIAIGQPKSADTVGKWVGAGSFDSVDLLVPAAYLLGAGLLIGLIATLRISPVGPIVAGLALLATYVSLFIDPLSVMSSLPRDLKLGSLTVDLRGPIVNGTTAVLGLALLIAAFSIKRWRPWPAAVPLAAEPIEPADVHEYPLGQGPGLAPPPMAARPGYQSAPTTAFPAAAGAAATSVLPPPPGVAPFARPASDETQPVFSPPPVSGPPVSAPPPISSPPQSPFAPPPVSTPPAYTPPVSSPPVSGPPPGPFPPGPFPPAPPGAVPQPVFAPPPVSTPPASPPPLPVSTPPVSTPPAATGDPGWLTPESAAAAEPAAEGGATGYSRGASSPPPAAEDAPPSWPVAPPTSPPPADLGPSGSWPVVPAPGGSQDTDDATRPLHTTPVSSAPASPAPASPVSVSPAPASPAPASPAPASPAPASPAPAGEAAPSLPTRTARGRDEEEEQDLLAGPSFDGFAVPSRPGREEETEAFHPGRQSPTQPRPRHAATGEQTVVSTSNDATTEHRSRFEPMAPQPAPQSAPPAPAPATGAADGEKTTVLRPFASSSDVAAGMGEATTKFEAPVADAEATANFGFGGETLTPAEAAERRAAFARGEAERRATAAQTQLDRVAAERATQNKPAAQPPAPAEDPEATTKIETEPRKDNPGTSPWAEPPRERG